MGNGIGRIVDVYLKTQSCESLIDCIPIATLKITRVKHTNSTITITGNDKNIEDLYGDLPKADHILYKDVNTFEHYSDKPVPILYGHLKSAPALLYIDGNQESGTFWSNGNILLLPDNSYLDDTTIGGI